MPNTEVLTLQGAKAIIRPNLPSNLSMEAVDRIMKEGTKGEIEKFGLFDGASPNYTTYYPDVTSADLTPTDAEFIYPVYRVLSKIVIDPAYRAIDFTQGDILKKSRNLLVGQAVMVDHEMMSGNVLGVIQAVYWQEAYTTEDGVKVPAGINAKLKIDGKANPRLARLIMMDPPALHSCSVTVRFNWDKSHPDLSDEEFYSKLGTKDSKGNLYSKHVSKILMYYENSLVPHGADPFAKKVENGQIVLAKQAEKIYQMSFADDSIFRHNSYFTPIGGKPSPYNCVSMSFSDLISDHEDDNTNNFKLNNTDMELSELLVSLGLDPTTIANQESFVTHIKGVLAEIGTLTQTVTDKDTEIGTLTQTVTSLTTERDEALTFKAQAEEVVNFKKNEAKRLLTILKGDKADAALLTAIDTMAVAAVEGLIADYQGQVENLMPLSCKDCGSKNVSRASVSFSQDNPPNPGNIRETFINKATKEATKHFVGVVK